MDNEINSTPESVSNPQRRQVMKAAAWAVPVVAVVASAPLAAASQSPDWDPTGSGVSGNILNTPAGSSTMTGRVQPQYLLNGNYLPTNNVAIPTLTATYNLSGAWANPAQAFTLGPGSTATNGLNVGSVITTGAMSWTVTINTNNAVTMVSNNTTVPGDTINVFAPRLNVSGPGDNSGNQVHIGGTISGVAGLNPTASFSEYVPII